MKIYQESDTAKEFRDNIPKLKKDRQEEEESEDEEDDQDENEDDQDDDQDDQDDEDEEVDEEDEDSDEEVDEEDEDSDGKKKKKDKKAKLSSIRSSFDGEYEYPSPKRDFRLTLEFKKAKARSITTESLGTALADIARQLLHKDYTISVMPASKKSEIV